MPHTTTKALRSKRVDTRPNGKQRKMMREKVDQLTSIDKIRVTRVQKQDRKERTAQQTPLSSLSANEKILRALKKKLKGIDDLIQKQNNGVELDEQQQQKIDSLPSIMADMNKLLNSKSENVEDIVL
eukprot:gene5292-7354_t